MDTHKLCYSIPEVVAAVGICRDGVYSAIREGRLVAHKVGKRTLIKAEDLHQFVAGFERAELDGSQ